MEYGLDPQQMQQAPGSDLGQRLLAFLRDTGFGGDAKALKRALKQIFGGVEGEGYSPGGIAQGGGTTPGIGGIGGVTGGNGPQIGQTPV